MPFIVMFDDSGPNGFDIPVVQVSMYGRPYAPKDEQALGAAVRSLRDEGILILSGGVRLVTMID
jgi:aromatic ring-opening dioxygenase catalytic subunit (LigB family)